MTSALTIMISLILFLVYVLDHPFTGTGRVSAKPFSEAMELMERHNVRRIPVIAKDKVAGIVSVTDLLLALMRKTNRIPDRPV